MKVRDIYNLLDKAAPFSLQDKSDNSGLLIGDLDRDVTKIALCLDVTSECIAEAVLKGANLIVTHHPIIRKPLSSISFSERVAQLIKHDIAVISAHTNFDMARMSDILLKYLGLSSDGADVLQPVHANGYGYGKFVDTETPFDADGFATRVKAALGCNIIRYTKGRDEIRRIAVCSGAGGDLYEAAIAKGCDALVTGDVKHNQWVGANAAGLALFDAGHFHTENVFCEEMQSVICARFGENAAFICDNSKDPVLYIVD
ncbi:MAG: Nif3-like dinuclear metal center hexameric protein [Oscillospiraceae bacterium]|jgi:dinuclear metal center YbgI/SA1388 family protein|nr:Nif3-like dinuclear metal center hexameric protein [Oscillospiraceae bacterium]